MLERELARSYHKLLSSLDWEDATLIAGLREGLNKFLSNAWLKQVQGTNKYHKTHYLTPNALAQLERREHGGLVFEHLVPKTRYIQRPCEECAARGELTEQYVEELLSRFWKLATVTKAEDAILKRLQMPPNWDGRDFLARYKAVGLSVQENPYFVRSG